MGNCRRLFDVPSHLLGKRFIYFCDGIYRVAVFSNCVLLWAWWRCVL